jgi:Trk K+ transport system NAD-binding subunit
MNTMIEMSSFDPRILQIAHHSHEIDVYLQSGADRIITPDVLMARGMFLILLTYLKETVSIIYENGHVFEYRVKRQSPLLGKSISSLNKMGYSVLILKKDGQDCFERNPTSGIFQQGDHTILMTKKSMFSSSSRL